MALLLLAAACAGEPPDAAGRVKDVVTRTAAEIAPGSVAEPVGDGDPWATMPCGFFLGTGQQRRYWVAVPLGDRGPDQAVQSATEFWSREGFEVAGDEASDHGYRYEVSVDGRRGRAIVAGTTPCTS